MSLSLNRLLLPIMAMAAIIVLSNILVSIEINSWITWGALSYPFAFLVTDLTNRRQGVANARKVVYVGFAVGVVASLIFAEPRIAMASGTAFLLAQLLDVTVFDKLRRQNWWIAPLGSSLISSIVDTVLFFSLAFYATGLDWTGWMVGDLAAKWGVALVALGPYALLAGRRSGTIAG